MNEKNDLYQEARKGKIKLRLAKEIIYVIVISVVCLSIYEIGAFLDEKNATELKHSQDKLDSLPQHQLLWYKLKKHKLYNKDYSNFKLEFNNTKDQFFLYQLVSNSGLYTKDFDDFRLKYFKKYAALDDCIALYYKEDQLTANNIQYQSESFWRNHRKKVKEFKVLLQDKKVLDEMYQIFVGCGYGRSKEDFKQLIFEPNKEELDKVEIKYLETQIGQGLANYSKKSEDLIYLILILAYPFRFLVLVLKWSIKQIQKK